MKHFKEEAECHQMVKSDQKYVKRWSFYKRKLSKAVFYNISLQFSNSTNIRCIKSDEITLQSIKITFRNTFTLLKVDFYLILQAFITLSRKSKY